MYTAQGVDLNLREVPGAIFGQGWNRESSYFTGLGAGKTVGTLGSIDALRSTFVENVQHGYELVLLQHRGKQTVTELGAAYMLRSPNLEIAQLRINVAGGLGLSHTFGTPSYEDGPTDDPDRRYRTQLLVLLEAEWSLAPLPDWSFVTRIHHRSGAYGVIAPRNVGSNFIVAGVRYRF
ncbi:hypothetical protein WG902_22265 [Ramlibacter sp. PS3R-8]|uniref:hypothetical protein n=1 Tax=Ramlibacter sp. PS3R-8 TaxID=3133437 RepID=UPI0030A31C5F